MKHIMLISNSFGSLYNFRFELIMKLLESYQVTLVSPMEKNDYPHFEEFQKKGCRLMETPFKRRGKNPLKDLSLLQLYKKILKRENPDLIITYTIKPNIYAGMAAAELKIPYFANVTGLGTAFEKEGLLKKFTTLLYKKGLKKCNLVFFQNQESCRIMKALGILQGKAKMVAGSGINLDKFQLTDYPETENYLYMARIMKEKGAEEFFDAAIRLKRKYPEISFDVVGFCEEAYDRKIKDLTEQGILRYYGWRDDPETFIRNCSLLVNPSYHEGMSNVCLEAAATGRPMVVSDIPGCRETVTDGETGYLTAPADAEDLYRKLEQFHLLPREEKIRMGKKGREKMEQVFDRRKVVEDYCVEIRRILGET